MGDPIGKSRMTLRQISRDSVVLTKEPESYEICRLTVTNEMSYDSVGLTKDTGVIRSWPIDCINNEKQRKN